MTESMVFRLSPEATTKYLSLAAARTQAEVESDCLPSGVEISVNIAPAPFKSTAYFGAEELGDVEISFD